MRLGTWLVVAVAGGLAIYKCMACVLPHGCTEIGCIDNVFVEAAFSDQTWSAGAYRLELQFDELVRECTFSVPADLPEAGSVRSLPCEPRDQQLHVNIEPATRCFEERDEDAVSQRCERIEGQYMLKFSKDGTPRRLQLRLERDGVLVSELESALTYRASRPNGPDCEPLCRQSRLELQLD